MTHRVQSIVDAAVAAIQARSSLAASVYRHRRQTLSADDIELPAVSVYMAEDTPLTAFGVSNLAFLDSSIGLEITAIAVAKDEQGLIEELLRLRREIHQGLMTDPTLGLAYVSACYYQGAAAPIVSTVGELLSGALVTQWRVQYRTSLTDPGA